MALVLGGCGGSRPPLNQSPETPITSALADSLAAVVRRQLASIQSVRGSAELRLRENESARPRRLDASLAVRRSGDARMRGRYGVLATIFDLRATPDSLLIYFPRDGVLVAGPLARWKSAPFPGAQELLDVLLPELPGSDAGSPAHWSADARGWVLTEIGVDAAGDTLVRQQTFEPQRLCLVRQAFTRLGPNRPPPLIIEYEKHRWTGSGWFPEVVRAASPGEPESCELRFTTSSLNGEIPDGVFRLDVPVDARRVAPEELSRRLIEETDALEKP